LMFVMDVRRGVPRVEGPGGASRFKEHVDKKYCHSVSRETRRFAGEISVTRSEKKKKIETSFPKGLRCGSLPF
jgi:hypothetical protein